MGTNDKFFDKIEPVLERHEPFFFELKHYLATKGFKRGHYFNSKDKQAFLLSYRKEKDTVVIGVERTDYVPKVDVWIYINGTLVTKMANTSIKDVMLKCQKLL